MTSCSPALKQNLLALIPNLRAFAISLCGDADRADDLVQDTLVRAWDHLNKFEEGTNLRAWLFTILRNTYFSHYRKRRREVEDREGTRAAELAVLPEQYGHLDLEDFRRALGTLPPDQREALVLVGAAGFSYEEAANVCGCAVGTIKSRVNRARTRLGQLLFIDSGHDFGVDPQIEAIVSAGGQRVASQK
jgi:RNA polymerase sigma-70 factor (ECF subfamily)